MLLFSYADKSCLKFILGVSVIIIIGYFHHESSVREISIPISILFIWKIVAKSSDIQYYEYVIIITLCSILIVFYDYIFFLYFYDFILSLKKIWMVLLSNFAE